MNWIMQVGHVAAKDLRQTRWLLLGYAAIVALTTRDASQMLAPNSGSPEGFVLLVVACGMLVVAAVTQADSPTRSDAFWASRPFDSSAVFAAKLFVTGAVVIGIPIVGQLVALLAIGAPTARLPLLLLFSGWSYALWLLAAMLVAALTRDLKSFAAVFIGICVVLLIFASSEVRQGLRLSIGRDAQTLLTLGGALVAAAVALTLYRTRDTRPRMWVVGMGATIVLLVSATIDVSPGLVISTARAETTASRRAATVTAAFVDASAGVPAGISMVAPGGQVRFHVRVAGATSTTRFSLSVATTDVYLRTGSVLHLPTQRARPFQLAFGGTPAASVRGYDVAANLNAVDRAAIGAGIDSMIVSGRVTVSERRALGVLPLAENASVEIGGAHLTLSELVRSADTISVTARIFSVDRSDGPSLLVASNVADLVLANDARGEELPFHATNAGGRGGVLVLPGNEVYLASAVYSTVPRSPDEPPFVVDDAWIRQSHVVVSTWVQAGSYPVRARVAGRP